MKKRFFFIMVTAIVLFACSKDNSNDNQGIPISFTTDIKVHNSTRATDAGFESNDQIGVYITKWSGDTQTTLKSTGNYSDNQLYTYSQSGFTSNPVIYYPQDNNKIDFYAYYPYAAMSSPLNLSFTVKADQSIEKEYTKSDLMTAIVSGRTSSSNPVPLAFNHALSKIVIILDETTVPSGTPIVKLTDVYINCQYNLADNSSTTTGSKAQITLKPDGQNRYIGILPPQTCMANQTLATITINGTNYTWKPSADIHFSNNTEHEYTLIFQNGDPAVFSATINPWGKPTINEVVPPEMQEKIKKYMPIYNGATPPNVMGTYLASPMYMIYSSISGETNDDFNFADLLFRFSNQNFTNNTLDYDSKQASSENTGKGFFISGTSNNFTVFFNTTGTSYGISQKTATVISGTITSQGIQNYRMAFTMLEKGSDPEGKLVPVGTYRVFKDNTELASNSTWTYTRSQNGMGHSIFDFQKY